MSKKYTHFVSVPFAGFLTAAFESDDERPSARDIASVVSAKVERLEVRGDVEIGEWDVLARVVDGNVCHAPMWEASVDETEVNE